LGIDIKLGYKTKTKSFSETHFGFVLGG